MDDTDFGETFGDGGIPCRQCKEYVDKHELSDERDNRGHRKWVCPTTDEESYRQGEEDHRWWL